MRQLFIAKLSPDNPEIYTTLAGFAAALIGTLASQEIIPEKEGFAAASVCYLLHAWLTNKPSKKQLKINETVLQNKEQIIANAQKIEDLM